MKRYEILGKLESLYACEEAKQWVATQHESATIADLWRDCPRADWMLWLACRSMTPVREEITATAWACAHMAQAWGTDATYAATVATYAADATRAAADAARAAREQCQLDCADLVRLLVTCPVLP